MAIATRRQAAPAVAEAAWRRDLHQPVSETEPVPGVPIFVFEQRLALSGAQPPSALLDPMRYAVATAATAQSIRFRFNAPG